MTKGSLLVVFYSRTGTTKKVAEAIATKLGCDIEEIIDTKSRRGLLGFLRSGLEATLKRLTTIEEIKNDPASYDVVIIGTLFGTVRCPVPFGHTFRNIKKIYRT